MTHMGIYLMDQRSMGIYPYGYPLGMYVLAWLPHDLWSWVSMLDIHVPWVTHWVDRPLVYLMSLHGYLMTSGHGYPCWTYMDHAHWVGRPLVYLMGIYPYDPLGHSGYLPMTHMGIYLMDQRSIGIYPYGYPLVHCMT